MSQRPRYLTLIVAMMVGACTANAQAAIVFDPEGDTFGDGPMTYDIHAIKSIESVVVGANLEITIDFFGLVFPASSFDLLAVYGFIDLDTDQDAGTTGSNSQVVLGSHQTGSHQSFFTTTSSGLGIEYYIDLDDNITPGKVSVVEAATNSEVGLAPISFTTQSLTVSVPLAMLGGDDGLVNFGAIVGDVDHFSDAVSVIPEPASLLVWLGLSAACVGLHFRRRRHLAARHG